MDENSDVNDSATICLDVVPSEIGSGSCGNVVTVASNAAIIANTSRSSKMQYLTKLAVAVLVAETLDVNEIVYAEFKREFCEAFGQAARLLESVSLGLTDV
ncbi:hypothetical protein [Gulosibacter sediminis]|uniref:hypothetical protein n=1 Tax=Gulosibacter sediminis TaxID=1729695 RepID=UPI0024A7E708|nr:hypothetical protein [Gulosibacter sediminis]